MLQPERKFGTLYIRKRTGCEWMVLLLFGLPFAFSLLTDIFRLPDFIKFSLDIILIALMIIMFTSGRFVFSKKTKPMLVIVMTFLAYTLITYMFHFQSPFYYIWGLRNNFRFYIAFFVFGVFVSYDDAKQWLKFLDVLFWINFVVMLFQFFILNHKQDFLGGIFGTDVGTNGFTLIFFCIIVSKSLLSVFNGTEAVWLCIIKSLVTLLAAAMAEMKFYYFVFIVVLLITSLMTKISKKKVLMLIVGILFVIIGSNLLTALFGFEDFLSLEGIWEYATKENYASDRDINRFSAIFTLSRNVMEDGVDRIFGLGLGNCDVSSIPIFNSQFHQNYGYLHYTWFTGPMVFLEMGIIGLCLYLSFFIGCFVFSVSQKKKGEGDLLFNQLAAVVSIVCILLTFYNSSLRVESAYIVFFILSLPFITKSDSEKSPLLS